MAVTVAGSGIAVGAQPAQAIVIIEDQCSVYLAGWIYWAHQANQELERNDFAITPYWEELWGWVEHYSHLLWVNNCP